ncbi:MAG: hypothetical protein N2712_02560 [Brevinematales bacterium]|nr:hypothetical protein [Brevinematales bacterium]
MKKILIILILMSIVVVGFSQNSSEVVSDTSSSELFSKAIIGFSSLYMNYRNYESDYGLKIDNSKFLLGISLGFASRGLAVIFTYGAKVYPINENDIGGWKIVDSMDTYTFDISYLFTVVYNYFYVGPSFAISIDNFNLKYYNSLDFTTFYISGTVKEISSKTVSLGLGVKSVFFRNIYLSLYFSYGFPSIYSYEGAPIDGSPVFQPTGLKIILSLGI